MKIKKEFKYFTIFNHEDEQDYLREMHKSGWAFIKVTGLGTYHFEEREPQDVIYQLDYNKEGRAQKEEYVKMFTDCGWEYLNDFAGYSYFRKSAAETDGNEEIFCDDESRQQMLSRVFKGRLIPLIFIMLLEIILFITSLIQHEYVFAVIFAVIILVYIAAFTMFAFKYSKFKK